MPVLSPVTPAPNWQSLSLLLVEDDRADILRIYKLRANAYVTKPVDSTSSSVRSGRSTSSSFRS
jgi:DNA-binding NarL/FixJ family response regulator